jgi:hypothetical protein
MFCPGSGTEPAQPKQPGLESDLALQAAFADINIRKSGSLVTPTTASVQCTKKKHLHYSRALGTPE